MKLPLNALRAFATVYAHGGIRAAARELGVAHSAVSRHLAELEAWLGVRVMEGDGRRGMVCTPQGETLAKAVLAGLGDIEHAIAAVREARSGRSVHIATTPSFAVRWLLPRLPRLEQSHPQLEVSVVVDQKLSDPDRSDVDLAVRMGPGPWPDLRCEPLMDDALYPVMSPALFEATGQSGTSSDLLRLRLLHDRDPSASWETWRRAHGPAELDVLSGPRYSSSDLVLRAASQGQGVALARHRLAFEDVEAGTLVRPLGDTSVALGTAYWIVLPSARSHRRGVARVIDWLKSEAALSPA